MSYSSCIHGGTCTGCMECRSGEEEIFICADCGDEIDPEECYEVDGEYLCKICVLCRFKISA